MEEKIFNLLEKMYIEMQEMKGSMATKEELQQATMATKGELRDIRGAMATKEELQEIRGAMATKEELQEIRGAMATKGELQGIRETMATKGELQGIRETMATKGELQGIRETMATKEELQKATMSTKKDIKQLENNMVRLEVKMDENFRALHDGYVQCMEGITEVGNKVDKLMDKVENQEIELQVLKSVK